MKIKENISLITKPIVVFIIGFVFIFITSASFPAFMGTAICLTIGTVFILVADAIKKFSNISKENCTYSTLGVISGYSKPDSDSAAFPVYTDQYGGNEYTYVQSEAYDGFISGRNYNVDIGSTVKIASISFPKNSIRGF